LIRTLPALTVPVMSRSVRLMTRPVPVTALHERVSVAVTGALRIAMPASRR
jgi:hypothetical protein